MASFKVAFAKGNEQNIKLNIQDFDDFESFGNSFSECQKGGKHENYFIRSGDVENREAYISGSGKEYKNIHPRCDSATQTASMLVIDADHSIGGGNAPCLSEISAGLVSLEYNHFGYTSHSQTEEINRCRIIVPCFLPSKEYLKSSIIKLVSELNDIGIYVEQNDEMVRWSQPWFMANRDNPDDGLFVFKSFHKGKDFIAIIGEEAEANKRNKFNANNVNEPNSDIDEIIQILTTGEDGYHKAQRDYSYGQIKDTVAPATVKATLKGFTSAWKEDTKRWQLRFDEIDSIVDGAVKIVEGEAEADIENWGTNKEKDRGDIPWPPGAAGVLCDDAYNMQIYQYKEVALVSGLGTIAGICGRKFNIKGSGLNIYMTLIMGTGKGKDAIGTFINSSMTSAFELITKEPNTGRIPSFIGASKFTGGKAVAKDLMLQRSMICVFDEAGLLLKSGSGDPSGLTRMLLKAYSSSGKGRILNKESYSQNDDSVPAVREPSLSIISEATPETLLDVYSDTSALENGNLPRQSLFRIKNNKPYENEHRQVGISEESKKALSVVMDLCSTIQAVDINVKIIDIDYSDLEDDIKEHSRRCTDIENKFSEENKLKSIMASRMHLKAIKFASNVCAYNHPEDKKLREDEWEFGKALAKYEYDGVEGFFANSAFNNILEELSKNIVAPIIIKILEGGYHDKKAPNSKIRSEQKFSWSYLNQKLKNNKDLKYKDVIETPSAGLKAVLNYMLDSEYLTVKRGTGNKGDVYKLSSLFKVLKPN